MKVNRIDLNLLVYLDALLRERNVTQAANQLNLSQPAMSNGLRRLRELFNDPLLVQLIDTALTRNLDLQVALQRVEMARAGVRASDLAPQVGAGQYPHIILTHQFPGEGGVVATRHRDP